MRGRTLFPIWHLTWVEEEIFLSLNAVVQATSTSFKRSEFQLRRIRHQFEDKYNLLIKMGVRKISRCFILVLLLGSAFVVTSWMSVRLFLERYHPGEIPLEKEFEPRHVHLTYAG